ncbi:MAG: Dna2/Cas4 domain-containing protein [Verrucomicrobia bacterium]|nr:Dna2/Cas4 domain-containing protein [Verrucomicrobiota bacterium]
MFTRWQARTRIGVWNRIANLLPEALEPKSEVPEGPAADTSGDEPPVIARSVSLGCEVLGLMGKLDLVSADPEGGEAVPVETKKSRVPNTPERSYPPERAQLMAQGLLLRAHGYTSNHGYIYYAGSRLRVRIASSSPTNWAKRRFEMFPSWCSWAMCNFPPRRFIC